MEQAASKLLLSLELRGGRSAYVHISDGVGEVRFEGWDAFCDPLPDLIGAVVKLFEYGDESRCEWPDDLDWHCWLFQRKDDLLHIAILGLEIEDNKVVNKPIFSTICGLWKFIKKLHTQIHQIIASEEAKQRHGGDWLRNSKEYVDLCELLEAHKQKKG